MTQTKFVLKDLEFTIEETIDDIMRYCVYLPIGFNYFGAHSLNARNKKEARDIDIENIEKCNHDCVCGWSE